MVLDIVTDPDGFFEREAQDPGWVGPIVLVLLTAALGIVGGIVPVLMNQSAAGGAGSGGALGIVGTVVGGTMAPVIRWVFYAVVLYGIPRVLYDGEGEFSDMFALSAWGFLPSVVATALYAVATAWVYRGYSPPQGATTQELFQYQQQFTTDPVLIVAGVVGIAFLFWSALIWVFAVKHGMKVTQRQAAISVAIPVALALVWNVLALAASLLFQSFLADTMGAAA